MLWYGDEGRLRCVSRQRSACNNEAYAQHGKNSRLEARDRRQLPHVLLGWTTEQSRIDHVEKWRGELIVLDHRRNSEIPQTVIAVIVAGVIGDRGVIIMLGDKGDPGIFGLEIGTRDIGDA